MGHTVQPFSPYDLIFIDGDHHPQVVYRDLLLATQYLGKGGLLVLHDVGRTWRNEVLIGAKRFLTEHPEYSLSVDGNLGTIKISEW